MASAGVVAFIIKGDWISESNYTIYNLVYYGGSTYVAKNNITGGTVNPNTDTTNWQLFAHGYIAENLSAIDATDTEGLLGEVGALVTGQAIIDELSLKTKDIDTTLSQLETKINSKIEIKNNDMGTVIGFMGDSHTEGVGVSEIRYSYPRQTVHLVGTYYASLNYINAGIGGDTSAQMVQRFEAFILNSMGIMVLWAGANDASASVPLSDYINNMTYMINTAQKKGIQVICLTVPPKEATGGEIAITSQPYIYRYNEWLKRWGQHHNVVVVDVYSDLVNHADGTLKVEYADTETHHINDLGHNLIATRLASAIRNKVLNNFINYPVVTQTPENLCTNGFMSGTSTLPDGWSGSVAAQMILDNTGILPSGKWIEIALPTDGNTRIITFNLDTSKYAVGDILSLSFISQVVDTNGNWVSLSKATHTGYIAGSLIGSGIITQSMDGVTGIETSAGTYTIYQTWLTGTAIDTSVKVQLGGGIPGVSPVKIRFGAVQVLNLTRLGLSDGFLF